MASAFEIPPVLPFYVHRLGFTFRDAREVSAEDDAAGVAAWGASLFDGWVASQCDAASRRYLCSENSAVQAEIDRRWDEEQKRNPAADWGEFEAEGRTVVDPLVSDPRLQNIRLVAYDASEIVGAYVLQNVREIRRESGVIHVRFLPLPGFPVPRSAPLARSWGAMARFLMLHDLPLVGGGALAVDEIELPDLAEARVGPGDGEGLSELWADLALGADAVEGFDSGRYPLRVRAIRARPSGEPSRPIRPEV